MGCLTVNNSACNTVQYKYCANTPQHIRVNVAMLLGKRGRKELKARLTKDENANNATIARNKTEFKESSARHQCLAVLLIGYARRVMLTNVPCVSAISALLLCTDYIFHVRSADRRFAKHRTVRRNKHYRTKLARRP